MACRLENIRTAATVALATHERARVLVRWAGPSVDLMMIMWLLFARC